MTGLIKKAATTEEGGFPSLQRTITLGKKTMEKQGITELKKDVVIMKGQIS